MTQALAEVETPFGEETQLSRTERAAVFLMLLGDDEAAALLSRMQPGELTALGQAMIALGEIDQPIMAEALQDFVVEAQREILPARDRSSQVRALLELSIGETKAESMMQRIDTGGERKVIEMTRWLSPSVLARLIEDEHPQMIAAFLVMLDPEVAADVLSRLSADQQSSVIERVARIGPISVRSIDMIDNLLSQRIGAKFGPEALGVGGAREAANLINLAAGDLRSTVLPAIAQNDEALAQAIEEQLFTFDMLQQLSPQDMGRLLRDVESEKLVDALKGISEEAREPFFAAMSSRAADGIRDEIELRGRMTKADAENAQRAVVAVAKELVEQGEISLGADDGEFV